MSLPAHTQAGEPISADAINRLAEETRMRTFGSSRAGHVQHRGSGIVVFKKPTGLHPAAKPSAGGLCAFDPKVVNNGDGTCTVTFRPGTINSMLPDNYLDGVDVPDDATRYISLSCTAASGEITAATFVAEAAPPAAIAPFSGEPPTAFKILVAAVTDGIATKVWGCGNIQAIGAESFRVQKGAPVAGQVPYDVYYTWALSLL